MALIILLITNNAHFALFLSKANYFNTSKPAFLSSIPLYHLDYKLYWSRASRKIRIVMMIGVKAKSQILSGNSNTPKRPLSLQHTSLTWLKLLMRLPLTQCRRAQIINLSMASSSVLFSRFASIFFFFFSSSKSIPLFFRLLITSRWR